MKEQKAKSVIMLLVLCAWLIPFSIPTIVLPNIGLGSVESEYNGGSLLFFGDMMLARHVETITKEEGLEYPFKRVENLLNSADVTIVNFEAAVPKKHKHTPDHTLTFSASKHFLPVAKDYGIDILSLANNHTYDYGASGYNNTRVECARNELICGGHPYELRDTTVSKIQVGDNRVGILFLHALTHSEDDVLMKLLIDNITRTTDVQIAYIHWGEEYESVHSERQEQFAHFLVDSGVDAVIGHHPHVVQDIEIYNEKPIFYSLGNFIFDQYFDDAVMEGLAVRLYVAEESVEYTLIPLTSKDTPSQPRIMTIDEKEDFFDRLVINNMRGTHEPGDSTKLFVRR